MVGDGFRVYNYFPGGYRIRDMVDPFWCLILIPNTISGLPPIRAVWMCIPHKGFETVTIAYKGSVAHHDSRVTAASFIRAMFSGWQQAVAFCIKNITKPNFQNAAAPSEMVQLWVNLPKKQAYTRALSGARSPQMEGMRCRKIAERLMWLPEK